MDEQELHEKLDKMKSAAVQAATEAARKELEEEFKVRLTAATQTAQKQAEIRLARQEKEA
jgi:GTP-binding protein EngB required for normal cell division